MPVALQGSQFSVPSIKICRQAWSHIIVSWGLESYFPGKNDRCVEDSGRCIENGRTFFTALPSVQVLPPASYVVEGLTAQCKWMVSNSLTLESLDPMCLFIAQCFLYAAPRLTFSSTTFCPHRVFLCFVWSWQHTAIISLYSINWLVSVTDMQCAKCAVRTGSLTVIQFKLTI